MSSFFFGARRHVGFQVGGVLLLLFVCTALLSVAWTPYPVDDLQMRAKLLPSSPVHLLGTDHLGRDVLSRIMYGARNSIVVGFVAVGIGMALGVSLGLYAAARRGWADELISRLSDLVSMAAARAVIISTVPWRTACAGCVPIISIFTCLIATTRASPSPKSSARSGSLSKQERSVPSASPTGM